MQEVSFQHNHIQQQMKVNGIGYSKHHKMISYKKPLRTGIFLVLLLFICTFVSAFGVGSAYHKDNPLKLSAGESVEVNFNLQNMAEPEDINFQVSIIKGSELIGIINPQESYFLPVGGSVDVKAKVTLPIDAKVGDVYPVEITFTTITEGESGTFGFGSSVGRSFDVIVVPKVVEKKEEIPEVSKEKGVKLTPYLIGVGILILILIIFLIIKYVKKKK